jgi:hypothetical protein
MMGSHRPAPARPRHPAFRDRPRTAPLSRDQARRQGEVANLAFLYLGGREGAMAFLNGYDPDLEGRPLDLAIASANGSRRVRLAIMRIAAARPGS